MSDTEAGRVLSGFNEKAGPLPVWAWGAIATGGLFVFEWWRNRQSTGTTGNPTGNPTGDAPPASGSVSNPPKAPRHEPHQPPPPHHGGHHGGGQTQPQGGLLGSQPIPADFPTTLGGIQSTMDIANG